MRAREKALKHASLNEKQSWQAIMRRDRTANGTFVFAVRSTGIYCRPSCPARRPTRQQVTFFHQPKEAEDAGFRPCRRCHPQENNVLEPQAELIEQVCRYIAVHLESPLLLSDLSRQFHLSPYHLQRTFKRLKGITPRQYAESCRLGHFKERLQDGADVTSALYDAGYHSSSSLYERVPAQLGMTPTAYQKGGKGMQIGYTIVGSFLGYILIAATARGVAAVRLGDSEAALQAELVQEYPEAELEQDEEGLRPWVRLLLDSLQGQPTPLTVPLDVHASTFQWKVWEALRAIPPGRTRSYREIAQAIGQPTATRAVAHACATNPVAVFIPCHRVVRGNGQVGGYRWGRERKELLLDLEQAHATAEAQHRVSSLSTGK
jgi:AraC family transcriptional regulator, regulatory protein of adaptative response / methylated-DNA-[protein]-cysteine methyltransferase